MDIDPEEVRRQYAELSDEGLLSIDRDDLTELARQYYDAEVAGRGLETETSQDTTSETHEELFVAETFVSSEEATMARALLRSADIPAYLENELSSTWTGIGGLRLMVPKLFLEQAIEILETPISDEDLAAQAESADPADEDQVEQDHE